MTESNWDASRRKHRRRLTVALFTVIPLIIVGGIIYYNNRDVVLNKPGKLVDASREGGADGVEGKQKQTKAAGIADSISKPASDSNRPEVVSGLPKKKSFDSVRVSGIELRTHDRPDVVLKFTISLFFTDSSMRSEILLRREEIRVVARKVLHNLAFGAIKKETVESRVGLAIKEIFENRNLDVKIADLQIEKVQKP